MKRILLLLLIFLVVLSINVIAVDFLDYDQEVSNADLNYGPGEGELEYVLTPLVYLDGEDQGIIEHDLLLELGVGENTEIYGTFSSLVYDDSNDSETKFSISFKNKNEIKDWKVAALAGYASISDGVSSVSLNYFVIGLLTDYPLSEKMVLYNNLVYEKVEEISLISLTNGLSYEVDEKTRFVIKVDTKSISELDTTSSIFRGLLEYDLNDNITYTGMLYKDTDKDNNVISNQIKLELMAGFSLTGLFVYNSSDIVNNSIAVGAEKEFEQLSLKGAYWTELGDNKISTVSFGLGYRF